MNRKPKMNKATEKFTPLDCSLCCQESFFSWVFCLTSCSGGQAILGVSEGNKTHGQSVQHVSDAGFTPFAVVLYHCGVEVISCLYDQDSNTILFLIHQIIYSISCLIRPAVLCITSPSTSLSLLTPSWESTQCLMAGHLHAWQTFTSAVVWVSTGRVRGLISPFCLALLRVPQDSGQPWLPGKVWSENK